MELPLFGPRLKPKTSNRIKNQSKSNNKKCKIKYQAKGE